MNTLPIPQHYRLARRELIALAPAQGLVIECIEGELWITADGSSGDILLAPGDRLTLDESPRVVISALRPARFSAAPRHGEIPARRIAAGCAARIADSIRRWRHRPMAAYPVRSLL